jgi:hypothetical protein
VRWGRGRVSRSSRLRIWRNFCQCRCTRRRESLWIFFLLIFFLLFQSVHTAIVFLCFRCPTHIVMLFLLLFVLFLVNLFEK